jgi:hypothetical protein
VYEGWPDPMRSLKIKQAVLSDAEDAVADTVVAIFRGNDRMRLSMWTDSWSEAKAVGERLPQ